jgi:hypothetical protein
MLVDEQEGIQLARAQASDTIGDGRIRLIGG